MKQYENLTNERKSYMTKSVIHNCVVCGHSIGLTFDHEEAKAWLKKANHEDKKIVKMSYSKPNTQFKTGE